MKINKEIGKEVEKIFDAKKIFHIKQAKLPIEEKIKILIELQKILRSQILKRQRIRGFGRYEWNPEAKKNWMP